MPDVMPDLDELTTAAETLMVPSNRWERVFTAPVVRWLVGEARAAAQLRRLSQTPFDESNREALGKVVRDVWVAWAAEQPDAKPAWLAPWESLPDHIQDVDMRIGEAVARLVLRGRAMKVATAEWVADAIEIDRDELKTANAKLTAELAAALKPFAEYGAAYDAVVPGDHCPDTHSIVDYGSVDGYRITIGDCRTAAATIARHAKGA